jgi:hypothetical protein
LAGCKSRCSTIENCGLTLELMGDLANGFLKAQVRKHTDVDLDL